MFGRGMGRSARHEETRANAWKLRIVRLVHEYLTRASGFSVGGWPRNLGDTSRPCRFPIARIRAELLGPDSLEVRSVLGKTMKIRSLR